MASDKAYLDHILELLSSAGAVSYRPMMGEFLLYYNGILIGGIYDDRLLLKPTPGALALTPLPALQPPYPGARDMLAVEEPDDRALLRALVKAVYADLAAKQKGK